MKIVAVAPLVGLASAAFNYKVMTNDAACNGCDSLPVDADATAVSDCLKTLDLKCKWTVTATWDGAAVATKVEEVCHSEESQIFRFPKELGHGLTFPTDPNVEILLGLYADPFKIDFAPATTDCILDGYTAFLPADPTCADPLGDWLHDNVTLDTITGDPASWERKLYNYANYVRFVPPTGCWSASDFLTVDATSVGKYMVTGFHIWTEGSSTTTTTEASSSATTEASSSATTATATSDTTSTGTSTSTSTSITPSQSTSTSSISTEASGEGPEGPNTESVRPLIAALSSLFAVGYLFF